MTSIIYPPGRSPGELKLAARKARAFSPEQNTAWRAEQRLSAMPRTLYGWTGVPTGRPTGEVDENGQPVMEPLPFPRYFNRFWSAPPKEIVLGAPRRAMPRGVAALPIYREALNSSEQMPKIRLALETRIRRLEKRIHEAKPIRYIVWYDRTLRKVDNVLRKQFAALPEKEQLAMVQKAAA